MIAAIGARGELGKDNELLWSIPEDMKWFQKHTMGKVIVMGRETYESIGRPLKKRVNVVLSRDLELEIKDVSVMNSIADVLGHYRKEQEIVVIGGGKVYEQFIPYTDKIYLTKVDYEYEADTFFPEMRESNWNHVYYREGNKDSGLDYSFNVYLRK